MYDRQTEREEDLTKVGAVVKRLRCIAFKGVATAGPRHPILLLIVTNTTNKSAKSEKRER